MKTMDRIETTYPLLPMQEGMLFHNLYNPRAGVDVEQLVISLPEALNTEAFERAWQHIAARHEVLRTSFHRGDGLTAPMQTVHPQATLPIIRYDWRQIPPTEQKARLETWLRSDREQGFDPAQPPLIRLALFRTGNTDYQCVWTFHHLVLDGRSLLIVLKEVFSFYTAFYQGQHPALAKPRPYRDYIRWFQEQDWAGAKAFWQTAFRGFSAPTPFGVDHLVPYDGQSADLRGEAEIRLSELTTGALQSLAREHSVTINTIIQAAWALLLSRYSGESDIVFGVTRACRHATIEDSEAMVGLFINTIPVRIQVPSEAMLLPWLTELRHLHLTLRDYERTPLIQIQQWSEIPKGNPLFESLLVLENYHLNTALQSLGEAWETRRVRLIEQPGYPLTINGYLGSDYLLKATYDRQRFDDATITRLLSHLKTLLAQIAVSPDKQLSDYSLPADDERHQLLVAWNNPPVKRSERQSLCLHRIFESQVKQTPDAIAIVHPLFPPQAEANEYQTETLAYRTLNSRANQLARYLRQQGVRPETLVGIYLDRTPEMIIAILAVLKAGGAYVPIDPASPPERLKFILQDAGLPLLLTQSSLRHPGLAHEARLICLDADWPAIEQCKDSNLVNLTKSDNLAYVIYTSGSTGKPKGVLVSHHNVIRLFKSTQAQFCFGENDVWTLFHSCAFDFSVWEIFGALLNGGQLVIVPYRVSRSPDVFYDLLCSQKVTVLNQTPSAFRQLIQVDQNRNQPSQLNLRLVIFGGEALALDILIPWVERYGDQSPQLVNMYGITETTVHVTHRLLTEDDLGSGSIIGRGIADLQVYILDQTLRPVPIGVPGELFIGGEGVARGYLNRPALTAERFIRNPFCDDPESRLYKSGDLARYLPNGDIEYLGRNDNQVKIRGFRIELGEIEAKLNRHAAVSQSVVVAQGNSTIGGEKQLVAYVIPSTQQAATTGELHAHLQSHLPDYMVPSRYVTLDRFPMTLNGKIDYAALPKPNGARPTLEKAFLAPQTGLEIKLASIWQQILGVEKVGVGDNFFELGGHSLLAVRLQAHLEKTFETNLPLTAIFHYPTIKELAGRLEEHPPVSPPSSLVALKPGGSKPPFFCVPGNLGNVHTDLGRLAQYFDPDRPFYGLQDNADNPTKIEALATHFLDEIRGVYPQGPYFLGGICAGGVVAFEMARQLRIRNQDVPLVALIEPSHLSMVGINAYLEFGYFIFERVIHRLGHHLFSLFQQSRGEQDAYVRLKGKLVANAWAIIRYKPGMYQGRLTLFLAQDTLEHPIRNTVTKWRSLVSEGVEVTLIPGTHDSVTGTTAAYADEEETKALANKLMAAAG